MKATFCPVFSTWQVLGTCKCNLWYTNDAHKPAIYRRCGPFSGTYTTFVNIWHLLRLEWRLKRKSFSHHRIRRRTSWTVNQYCGRPVYRRFIGTRSNGTPIHSELQQETTTTISAQYNNMSCHDNWRRWKWKEMPLFANGPTPLYFSQLLCHG